MGRDKATLRLGGRTLLELTVERVREAGGEPLVIGPPRGDLEVAGSRQVDEAEGTEPGLRAGPLPALRHGLKVCGTRSVLALACDLPLVPADLLRFLVEQIGENDAVVPRAAGELQVLTAAYTTACLEAIERHLASGSRSVHGFLPSVRLRVIGAEELERFGGEEIFQNVNTPGDLARAEAQLAARRMR